MLDLTCYLKIGGRTFFAIVKDAYPVGKDVRFDIDYKSIAIKEGDDEIDIVKPLSVYDTYLGLFTNLENNTRAVKSLCKLSDSICEEKVKELNLLNMVLMIIFIKNIKTNIKKLLITIRLI